MKNFILLACLFLFLGCETNSEELNPVDLYQDEEETMTEPTSSETEEVDWCSLWREEWIIVEELQKVEGKVVESGYCGQWVLIDISGTPASGTPQYYLGPCNLPEEFKKDGAEIILSGYVYGEPEDRTVILCPCAPPFEITAIKFKD